MPTRTNGRFVPMSVRIVANRATPAGVSKFTPQQLFDMVAGLVSLK